MAGQTSPIIHYALLVVGLLVLVVLGRVVYSLLRRGLRTLVQRQYLSEPVSVFLQGLGRWVILILVVLLVLQQFGVHVAGIWATLLTLAGMVVVGFIAVWSLLSNILCALLMIIFTPFRIGDEIEIIEATGGKGLRGKVVSLNILFTYLQETTEDATGEVLVQVPNNVIFQKTIRRRKGTETRSLDTSLFAKHAPETASASETR